MKKKALVLASCVAFATPTISIAQAMPNNSVGLNLGDINATSYLNQPFKGSIPFLFTSVESTRQLSVRLAPEHVFDQIGAEKLPILNNLQFHIVNQSNKPVIQISSNSPIQLPFLNFVLEIEGPEGVLYQDYTVLLDPQGYQAESQITQGQPTLFEFSNDSSLEAINDATYQSNESEISNNDLPVTYSSTSVVTNKAKNHKIKSGDSLSRIAKQYKPNDISLNKMMRAIFDKNPKAFIRGDIDKIKRGVVLTLPSHKELTGLNNIAKKIEFKGKTPKVSEVTLSKDTYKVVKGDSLSKITQKFVDKDTSFTKMMNAIFTANPEAFSQNNKSQLKAGATLKIPSFNEVASAPAEENPKVETPAVTTVAISSESTQVKPSKIEPEKTASTENTAVTKSKTDLPLDQLSLSTSNQNSTSIVETRVLEENEYRIKEGDTLTKIAKDIGYKNVSFTKMMKAIYTENPQSFEENNITKLKVGSVLVLPELSVIEGVTSTPDAKANIDIQAKDEVTNTQKLSDSSVASTSVNDAPEKAGDSKSSEKSNVINMQTKLAGKIAANSESVTEKLATTSINNNAETVVSPITSLDTSNLEKRIRELRSELDQAQSGLSKMKTELSTKDAIIFEKDSQLVDLKSSLIKLKISNEQNQGILESQELAPEDIIIEDELYPETTSSTAEAAALSILKPSSIAETDDGFNQMLSNLIQDYSGKTSPKNLAYLSMALILGWLLIRYRREIYSYTAINLDEPKYYPAPGIDDYVLKERNITHQDSITEIDPIKEYVEDIENNSIAELYSDPVQEFTDQETVEETVKETVEEIELDIIENEVTKTEMSENEVHKEESISKETKEIEHCEHLVTELFSDLNSSSSSKTEVSIGDNEWLSIEKICDDYIESKNEEDTKVVVDMLTVDSLADDTLDFDTPKVAELNASEQKVTAPKHSDLDKNDVIDFKDAKPATESDVTDFDEMMSDLLKSLDGVEKSININSSLKRKVKDLKADPTEKST
ncbi:LysM peptidoglycan-binding domain-containing protein [Cocleimonas sp. KMM 6892]|uniref:FimV/HubP family polar landmark protein n=1 Tax=unclassified Cocleimonas TaxID=2639732 RepID=UPI002DBDF555|nr:MULTISPECIES: FimV/HubP family polar landmark protein [unclassified Cocleimonas]MEB8431391.1 LysM peptidoglycan-binding domain-containing protein [Cocleimonas sp. KMM 6892]MEC4713837.1 LysM peptidoglycan-binding domain-containing protein [Cocleimonas sp. KMM 6895]MEC4743168.1 LysM peptidoglycan-binding domain-containing protein [Cocleimonas sp. KMM 6896]